MSPLRVAVVLSGCGFKDGSEIQESVAALFHLASAGAVYDCFAPDREFAEVDHLTGEPTGKMRNALHEAARIARGEMRSCFPAAMARRRICPISR